MIVTDLGVLALAKRYAPRTEVHISTQAGIVNYQSARAFMTWALLGWCWRGAFAGGNR
ncbi:MAG: U32 family peptidase [[Clostridium] leptum]